MAAQKNALGRGLGALINDPQEVRQPKKMNNTSEIKISSIQSNPYQPRLKFEEDAINELADSIRALGIIQPITVRKLNDSEYQLISGERRLRASKLTGLTSIPAFIRSADDQLMSEMAIVENLQRRDLDPIEIAIGFQRLVDEMNLTQQVLSERVGKKRATVTNYLRLLSLPPVIQKALQASKITMGHAKALIAVENDANKYKLLEKIIKEDLSVRKSEELARKYSVEAAPEIDTSDDEILEPTEYDIIKGKLNTLFNKPVDFKRGQKGSGKITIPFSSDSELEELLASLGVNHNIS